MKLPLRISEGLRVRRGEIAIADASNKVVCVVPPDEDAELLAITIVEQINKLGKWSRYMGINKARWAWLMGKSGNEKTATS